MDDERVVEAIVSEFLLNSCRPRLQFSKPAIQAVALCAIEAAKCPTDDAEAHYIPQTTGSVAEFYIEPMLPHFGDVDVMCHVGTLLAIPRGQPPPTQLPAEFHNNYVRVCEMVDSHLPGYVYLELRYLLTECSDERKYNAVEYDRDFYMSNHCLFEGDTHGPAVNIVQGGTHLSFDQVYCVRCLMWPPQAADWRTRQRNYGWPDSTVDRVVNNGCDVVPVAHRQRRQHEWMGKRQWRLSFSRAEVVLLNNWMPVQQIVYHMLRVFMKAEGLTGDGDSGEMKLSNYQSKTLMLWACELKPRSWWTHDLSLVRICVELLHDLAVWLTEARFPHYFINKCNLVDNSLNLDISRLMSVSKSWLSLWFINNYILKCSQLCPRNVSRLFDDVSTSVRLQRQASVDRDCPTCLQRHLSNIL